jgi:hypothetical protein
MTLALTGCSEESGSPPRDGAPSEAGTTPDSSAPDSQAADQRLADHQNPDRRLPDQAVPDRAIPDAARTDRAGPDAAGSDLGPSDSALATDAPTHGCPKLTRAVLDAMAQIAKCTATSQCTFLWGICPFGCHVPYNKSASLTAYNAAIAAFQASSACRKCTYRCGPPGTLSCKGGACVMTYP